ncbi:MAG: AMP-binding protein, partial [Gammaproteobacteria bacterium]|nr:AMP-binding protein [Gammaproteobacteria bacterium]
MFSLSMMVRRAAQLKPEGLATVDGERSQTWSHLQHKLACFAGGLKQLGISQNDCAAILALNSDRYFEFMFATPWAGGVFQPINTRLAGPEVEYWLNDSEASVLFVDTTFVSLIADIKDKLKHVKHLVFIDDGEAPEGYISYDELVDNEPIADAGRHDDDVAGLFYTGGTTGRSKGVMLTHKNLCINSLQSLSVNGAQLGDRVLHVAPMFHIADAFVCMISATVCGSNYFQPGFDPLATLRAIADYKIQRMLLVPTMINMVVYQPTFGDFDTSSLQGIWYGASPMPEAVIRQALSVLPEVKFVQAYGQTEASPCVTMLAAERHCFDGP